MKLFEPSQHSASSKIPETSVIHEKSEKSEDYVAHATENEELNQENFRNLFHATEELYEKYTQNCRNESEHKFLQNLLSRFRRKFYINNAENLELVCQFFERTLVNELPLVRVNDVNLIYRFFGDLHGSFSDLALIRSKFWSDGELNGKHFIFLGDYVDRGIHGFEVVIYLFILKSMYPNSFTILRGNHEFSDMNRQSFLMEMRLKFGNELGYQMWSRINVAFGALPYAAIICENIFACHGGIPKHLRSMEQIEQIPKWVTNDLDESCVGFQLIWNDFYTKDLITSGEFHTEPRYFSTNRLRGAGFIIGNRGAERFLTRFRLGYIVRAHQYPSCEINGYDYIALNNGAVFTLFSNSSYVGDVNNTAYLHISILNEQIKIYPLVDAQQSEEFFNKSELIEPNDAAAALKHRDPFFFALFDSAELEEFEQKHHQQQQQQLHEEDLSHLLPSTPAIPQTSSLLLPEHQESQMRQESEQIVSPPSSPSPKTTKKRKKRRQRKQQRRRKQK
ncbi:uncharacterized protein LOC113791775 [Dermatophagoides pteronyssinus]|uniref:Serine/threonine-protein phosphatase n=1 Tax=Dermatophagoides pteronyssinus TaxID=6956 RepID=A0ABQ8JHK6_DERPT|nr:hypothetical protein DERP_002099 [Dermatophagoides pteronyssinus]